MSARPTADYDATAQREHFTAGGTCVGGHCMEHNAENGPTVEIDEDPEAQAAFLRSLGLDPETATIEDLNRVLPLGAGDE